MANASNKLTEKASTLFKNAWDDTAPYVTQVKDKVSAINKQTTITNPLIKDVYGSGVSELTESYVKGLAYDTIPTLIDETLPDLVVSYMESGDAQKITLRFGKDGTVTGTVGVYDGSDYLGDLNFTAK